MDANKNETTIEDLVKVQSVLTIRLIRLVELFIRETDPAERYKALDGALDLHAAVAEYRRAVALFENEKWDHTLDGLATYMRERASEKHG